MVADDHPAPQQALSTVADAVAHVAGRALCPAAVGPTGLELEGHLVDRRHVLRRVPWAEVSRLAGRIDELPRGSVISVEPGGQLELSTRPASDLSLAVGALRDDEHAFQEMLRDEGYGLAFLGLDPARPGELVNPAPRYAVMARYFDRVGCGAAGRMIMTASAGLQLNLEAGPAQLWARRLGRLDRLGPVLGAASACSSTAAGRRSGWASMRQQGWAAIEPARTAPVQFGDDPAAAWADYALAAPVMLVRSDPDRNRCDSADQPDEQGPAAAQHCAGPSAPTTKHAPGGIEDPPPGLSFADWVRTPGRVGRRPTIGDLDYHLTTLFPPIRPRGFLELRFLDAVPMSLWPGLAALVGTLLDHPTASDRADELLESTDISWLHAAEIGLRDPALHALVVACAGIAVDHCPTDLRSAAVAYAEMLAAGRTPGDRLRSAAGGDDRRLLEEALDA